MISFPLFLTLLRLIVSPLFLFPLLVFSSWMTHFFLQLLVCTLFVVLSLTDFFDGFFARRFHQVSTVGALLDPLADKILVVSVMLPLLTLGLLPIWVGALIIVREFFVMGLREIALMQGFSIPVGWSGKIKACVQSFYLGWILTFPYENSQTFLLMLLVVVLTIYSGCVYAQVFIKKVMQSKV